jgi:hypothetical protein
MQASDVTATLDLALAAAGLDQVQVVHRRYSPITAQATSRAI